MKIIIDENIPYIRGRLEPLAEVVYADQDKIDADLVRDADIIIIRTRTRADASLLEGSRVKTVATATIGTDHIDIPWCEANGIRVVNAPGCNAPAVAQYVWSSLLRQGFDPSRHTLGIVGCGHVGSIVKEWGELLGARILVSDPPIGENLPLDTLLRESDAVTLHTPLTKSGECPTFHLIGEGQLAAMRPGAILINAARGPVVDNQALKQAVLSGHIRAIVDTWEGEPAIDPELLASVTYATPHIAGYSQQGKERAVRQVLEALCLDRREEIGDRRCDSIVMLTDGLCGAYVPLKSLTPQPGNLASTIVGSYDPAEDTAMLRRAFSAEGPKAFERLRHDYNYRPEPFV